MIIKEDMDNLDILLKLQFHSIGMCQKHTKLYQIGVSNLVCKMSQMGYGK